MENNDGNHKTITHDFPVWRDKADFILAALLSDSDVPKEWKWEQIWARRVGDNIFEICCIPFFVYGLALGDLISTATIDGEEFVLNEILERNGHFTYRIWFLNTDNWNSIVKNIRSLDCSVEVRWAKSKLIAVDAANSIRRRELEAYLLKLQSAGIATFESGT